MTEAGSERLNPAEAQRERMRELGKRGGRASGEARRRAKEPRFWGDELRQQVAEDAPAFVAKLLSTGAGAVAAARLLEQAEREHERRAQREAAAEADQRLTPSSSPISAVIAALAKSGALSDEEAAEIVNGLPSEQLARVLTMAGHDVEP
jgi:hypothetical protein